jgi:conjugal transfer mating pair stabilization protein TraN
VPGAAYVGQIQTYQGSTVDNADCQAKLKALPTGETCLQPTQVCVDASPTTRTINGVAVTHDCWQWQATYQCSTLSSANDCATLSAKSTCSFDHEVCLDSPQTGACQVKSEVYKCTTPAATQTAKPIPAAAMSIASTGAAPSFRHRRRLIWPMRSWP